MQEIIEKIAKLFTEKYQIEKEELNIYLEKLLENQTKKQKSKKIKTNRYSIRKPKKIIFEKNSSLANEQKQNKKEIFESPKSTNSKNNEANNNHSNKAQNLKKIKYIKESSNQSKNTHNTNQETDITNATDIRSLQQASERHSARLELSKKLASKGFVLIKNILIFLFAYSVFFGLSVLLVFMFSTTIIFASALIISSIKLLKKEERQQKNNDSFELFDYLQNLGKYSFFKNLSLEKIIKIFKK